jgi:D-erythro-7,8-dihydroneopterin triphosphate epimerase
MTSHSSNALNAGTGGQTREHGMARPDTLEATERPRSRARAGMSNAVINVSNLRLRTFIGFNPDEKVKRQDVVVSIEIGYALDDGVFDDRVEAALDYKSITKDVIEHVENGRFLLLEKLVADVLDICTSHPSVEHARVRIEKPHALRFADSVSLTLEFYAGETDIVRER